MPTLGEIAQFQQAVLGGIPKTDLADAIGKWGRVYREANALQKERFELDQSKENLGLDILGSTLRDPSWKSNDPYVILGTIGRAKEEALRRGGTVTQGGVLDQAEAELFRAVETGDPNAIANARIIAEQAVTQRGSPDRRFIESGGTSQIIRDNTTGGGTAIQTTGGFGRRPTDIERRPYDPNEPIGAPSQVPPGQAGPQTQPQTQSQNQAQPAPIQSGQTLPYAQRRAGDITPFRVGEENDFKRGEEIKTFANTNQNQIAQVKFNVESGIKTINEITKGRIFQVGALGSAEKAFEQELQQNTNYAQLAKDQARINMQLNSGNPQWASTDQGRATIAIANGEGAPPRVVQKILLQNLGEATKNDLQTKLILSAGQRYGNDNPANLPHIVNQFNQLGGDFRTFQIIGLYTSNLSQADKAAGMKVTMQGVDSRYAEQLRTNAKQMMSLLGIKY